MTNPTLHILIADDHAITRRGMKEILQDEFGRVTVGEARDLADVRAQLGKRSWDLMLLDIIMPGVVNIVDLLVEIRSQHRTMPILILTAVGETEYAVRTLKAGANGYITKQRAPDELILAVRQVMAGQTYLSPAALNEVTAALRGKEGDQPHEALSERELQVFTLIAKGETLKEIAADLGVSEKTIGTYLARIRDKTGLVSYVEIARYAIQHRLAD